MYDQEIGIQKSVIARGTRFTYTENTKNLEATIHARKVKNKEIETIKQNKKWLDRKTTAPTARKRNTERTYKQKLTNQ